MDAFAALDASADEFFRRLVQVGPGDWARRTPCEEWDVAALVAHVIRGAPLYRLILAGAAPGEVAAARTAAVELGDAGRGFTAAHGALVDAFRAEEDTGRMVAHPSGPMPVSQLMRLRVGDVLVHAWDLARALGADEALNPDVVGFVLEWLAAAPGLPAPYFAPAVEPDGDASPAARLLMLTGRQP